MKKHIRRFAEKTDEIDEILSKSLTMSLLHEYV